jgi:hypothetical protein
MDMHWMVICSYRGSRESLCGQTLAASGRRPTVKRIMRLTSLLTYIPAYVSPLGGILAEEITPKGLWWLDWPPRRWQDAFSSWMLSSAHCTYVY